MSRDITPHESLIFGRELADHPLDALALPLDAAVARAFQQATFYRAALQASQDVLHIERRDHQRTRDRYRTLLQEARELRATTKLRGSSVGMECVS